ncbi:hypothetical protein ATANTOWER_025379 [Ataeniobius toweri]|uniref:Uncharacterized protein n=1 Tax=Ataeniobius toweri TaxID=208326 RepID=A0ABU7ABZ6_9TELE|nr:hypothetical protein [Ataeniobius toweri]
MALDYCRREKKHLLYLLLLLSRRLEDLLLLHRILFGDIGLFQTQTEPHSTLQQAPVPFRALMLGRQFIVTSKIKSPPKPAPPEHSDGALAPLKVERKLNNYK